MLLLWETNGACLDKARDEQTWDIIFAFSLEIILVRINKPNQCKVIGFRLRQLWKAKQSLEGFTETMWGSSESLCSVVTLKGNPKAIISSAIQRRIRAAGDRGSTRLGSDELWVPAGRSLQESQRTVGPTEISFEGWSGEPKQTWAEHFWAVGSGAGFVCFDGDG